jgi:hypothetical protein
MSSFPIAFFLLDQNGSVGRMSFNPPLMLLPMLQYLGSMQLLARRAPAREFATAQGRLCHRARASHGGRHGALRCSMPNSAIAPA